MRPGNNNNLVRRSRLIAAFIFVAIAVRAMIPLGYMPGNALAGEFLVLCPQGISDVFAAALHYGHSSHADAVLDVGSSCPIGQGLNYDAMPNADVELSAAPAVIEWMFGTLVASYIPPFEPRYATRAPPLI